MRIWGCTGPRPGPSNWGPCKGPDGSGDGGAWSCLTEVTQAALEGVHAQLQPAHLAQVIHLGYSFLQGPAGQPRQRPCYGLVTHSPQSRPRAGQKEVVIWGRGYKEGCGQVRPDDEGKGWACPRGLLGSLPALTGRGLWALGDLSGSLPPGTRISPFKDKEA